MSPSTKSFVSLLVALMGLMIQLANAQTELFQGYSIGITSAAAKNATFGQANFFSYGTPTGYLTFGWNLKARYHTLTKKCVPDSDDYEFFEYSVGTCGYTDCKVHTKNYANVPNPKKPLFEGEYVSRFLSAGESPAAKLALSYFDPQNGFYAVGTRDLLSGSKDPATVKKCNQAFATLQRLQAKRKLPLSFVMANPC